MIQVSKVISQGRGLASALLKRAATVELDWDVRQKSRFAATDSTGRELGIFLPRGTVVRGGDVLVAEDGSLVRVLAAPQPVLVITACTEHGTAFDLTRAAYHLGNRHVPIELQPDHLKIEPDHVLADMLRAMHLTVTEAQDAFEPEGGAYAAGGHGHGHEPRSRSRSRPCPRCRPRSHARPRTDRAGGARGDPGRRRRPAPCARPGLRAPPRMSPGASPLAAASLLQLIWLASPALPIGGFSYSEGLEASVDRSFVATESEASDWLTDQLHLTLARADLPVLAQAVAAWQAGDLARVRTLNDWVLHTRESSELRLQAEQMGRSLLEWLRNQDAGDAPRLAAIEALAGFDPTYPVAFALAASRTGAPVRDIALAYAFGWAENMVQAALKAVPLGQNAGQRILARLTREIPDAVEAALARPAGTQQAFAPMLAILSARHETQYSRLFRS
jgi:urease accessory protein